MKTGILKTTAILLALSVGTSVGESDSREWVDMPESMQTHMLANMRDHLVAMNEILQHLSANDLDKAADVAENRLGMSSTERHGATKLAEFMPPDMRHAGARMHRAASRFARKAQEGELLASYALLAEITEACADCHAAFRIR